MLQVFIAKARKGLSILDVGYFHERPPGLRTGHHEINSDMKGSRQSCSHKMRLACWIM